MRPDAALRDEPSGPEPELRHGRRTVQIALQCHVPATADLTQLLHDVLTSRVYDVARETPLDPAPKLSARLGNDVLLKREDLQPVFSFKLRGAYNKIAHLSRGASARAASSPPAPATTPRASPSRRAS